MRSWWWSGKCKLHNLLVIYTIFEHVKPFERKVLCKGKQMKTLSITIEWSEFWWIFFFFKLWKFVRDLLIAICFLVCLIKLIMEFTANGALGRSKSHLLHARNECDGKQYLKFPIPQTLSTLGYQELILNYFHQYTLPTFNLFAREYLQH